MNGHPGVPVGQPPAEILDLAGAWDPTLACVMLGALLVTASAFPLVLRRRSPVCADAFSLPAKKDVDLRLLAGAMLFGVGWGIGGLCPGPALAGLVTGNPAVLVFVLAMAAGMVVSRFLDLT